MTDIEAVEMFLSNGWCFEKLPQPDGQAMLFDTSQEELFQVPDSVFNILLKNRFFKTDTISDALNRIKTQKAWPKCQDESFALPFQITLRLLTYRILIRCKFKACYEHIRMYYLSFVEEDCGSPDVIIDCQWSEYDNETFTRLIIDDPGPLYGVKVHSKISDRHSCDAPTSVLKIHALRDQFVGIHAAIVQMPNNNGLMIVGPSGYGKTSAAVELTNNYGCSLLTDEAAIIHRRTQLAEPFTCPLGMRTATQVKVYKPAGSVVTRMVKSAILITHCILLEKSADKQPGFEKVGPSTAFKYFLSNHQDFQCNLQESIITLLQLARNVSTARFYYSSYEDLLAGCGRFYKFCD